MDAKRHPEKEYIDSLAEVYRHRYTDPDEFDLIICTDNHAIDFICSDDGIEIFPGVPIVFCGANSYDSKWKENRPLLTGIVETIEPADTLNTILKLHPNTKRILVVSDHHTLTSLIVTESTRKEFEPYADRVRIDYLEDMTASEMQQEVASLSEDTIVFLLLFNHDKAGQEFTFLESIKLISTSCKVPVYSVWDFYLGHGIVGGKLLSGENEGKAASELAIRVPDGDNISEMPVITSLEHSFIFWTIKQHSYYVPRTMTTKEIPIPPMTSRSAFLIRSSNREVRYLP